MTASDYGRALAAAVLADHLAAKIGVSSAETYGALRLVPDSLLCLLDCPEGWTALAGYVATGLGAHDPALIPTVH